MSAFQYIGILTLGAMIFITIVRMVRRRSVPKSSVVWIATWSIGVIALADPEATTRLARMLGVNRGADLLLYVSVLLGVIVTFVVYTQLRRADRNMTLLVRELALRSPGLPADPESPWSERTREFSGEA